MFKWLQEKAKKQSLFNVRINVKTLISISNRADERIQKTGMTDPRDMRKVQEAQVRLLKDAELCIANGGSLEEIAGVLDEVMATGPVSEGARLGVSHVLASVSGS